MITLLQNLSGSELVNMLSPCGSNTTDTITLRIDNVTGIPPSHRAEVIPPPRSVKVELTSRCNYVCSFCVKSLLPSNDDMKREDFSRWMRDLHSYGVVEAGMFFLGESISALNTSS